MDMTKAQREIDARKKEKWLKLYCAGGITVVDACTKVDVSIGQVSRWRKTDLAFSETYDQVEVQNREIFPAKIEESTKKIKETWLKTYDKLYFNMSETCKACGVPVVTASRWLIEDEEFQEAFSGSIETKKDFIEGKLIENIQRGDIASVIFACKTQLQDRGYIEKQQIEHSGNFGVMLSPGIAQNANDWEKSAKAQQIALVEKTNRVDEERTNGELRKVEKGHLGTAGRKPERLSKLSNIRSAV